MRNRLSIYWLLVALITSVPMLALAAPPPNDSFDSPTVLSGFPVTAAGTNVDATLEPGEPLPPGGSWPSAQASVWFRWTAATSGPVQIDTLGSGFDTMLAVWSGNTLTNLALIAQNDDYDEYQSAVFISAQSGVTYRVAVYGWSGGRGAITLNVTNDVAGKISGTVTGPDGVTPLQGIIVYAYLLNEENEISGSWTSSTEAAGNYELGRLVAGTYRVKFHDPSGDYVSEYYDDAADLDSGTNIVVSAGATVPGINASLANASKITGTVTGPNGVPPLQGIIVYAYLLNEENEISGTWASSTDYAGNYSVGGLIAGTYYLEFSDPNGDYLSQFSEYFYVPPGHTIPGKNASLAKASKITGTVTGPDGVTPLQGISVYALYWNEVYEYWASWTSSTDVNGNYSIGGLVAETYRVEFWDLNGDYLPEYYDNATDLDFWTDVVVPAGTIVSNINASLASSASLEPPRIDALRKLGGSDWELQYVSAMGKEYILQQAASPTNSWQDVGESFLSQPGTNTIPLQSSATNLVWRIREYP